jgi:hypothetical protein
MAQNQSGDIEFILTAAALVLLIEPMEKNSLQHLI